MSEYKSLTLTYSEQQVIMNLYKKVISNANVSKVKNFDERVVNINKSFNEIIKSDDIYVIKFESILKRLYNESIKICNLNNTNGCLLFDVLYNDSENNVIEKHLRMTRIVYEKNDAYDNFIIHIKYALEVQYS